MSTARKRVNCFCGSPLKADGACSYPWCVPQANRRVLEQQRMRRKANDRTGTGRELHGFTKDIRAAYKRLGSPGGRTAYSRRNGDKP